jgi:MEMO1 family protein
MRPNTADEVRPSSIAGTWYPDNPEQLAAILDQMLAGAPSPPVAGRIRGMVVPHAGYRYSGPVAARAFRLIKGLSYERVIVISPMHHAYSVPLLTSAHSAYKTPLGTIPIDTATLDALGKRLPLTFVGNDPEHALEIELPFLQRVISGSFMLIPLMLRDQSYETAERVGRALVEAVPNPQSALLVASSDLSHFYTEMIAQQFDHRLLSLLEANDPQELIKADDEGKAFACGKGAIAAVLIAARGMGACRVQLTGYGTSADASGDTKRVVGYGSAVIFEDNT